jgi:hypothetical protein
MLKIGAKNKKLKIIKSGPRPSQPTMTITTIDEEPGPCGANAAVVVAPGTGA